VVDIDCMHTLAFDAPKNEDDIKFQDRRLLAVLSNVIHTSSSVFKELWELLLTHLPKQSPRLLESTYAEVGGLMRGLKSMVQNQYVRTKTLALNQLLRHGLFTSGMGIKDAGEPRGIYLHASVRTAAPAHKPMV
jgi:hypothetical protein